MKDGEPGYDVLASVLEHMAIAYSSDGSVNVRFPDGLIRRALRKGAVQLRRRHRQKLRNFEKKAQARVLRAELKFIVSSDGGAR